MQTQTPNPTMAEVDLSNPNTPVPHQPPTLPADNLEFSEDFSGDFDAADLKLPILRIIQGQAAGPGLAPGTLMLDKQVLCTYQPERKLLLIPLQLEKMYRERTTDPTVIARVVRTRAEVRQAGGKLDWSNNTPPTWSPFAVCTALLRLPEEAPAEARHHFPLVLGKHTLGLVRLYLRGQQYKTAQAIYATAIALAAGHAVNPDAQSTATRPTIASYWWEWRWMPVTVQKYTVWTWEAQLDHSRPVEPEIRAFIRQLKEGAAADGVVVG